MEGTFSSESMTVNTARSLGQSRSMKRFFLFSLVVHLALAMILFIKSVLLPSFSTPYLPSLRVDLVALPDQKKNDTLQPPPAVEKPVEEKKEVAAPPKEVKVDVKPVEEKGEFTVVKKKKTPSKKEKEAKKKLSDALARIKAIERIKAMTGDTVKGNQISKGSALSGDAKTSLETTYFDVVLERVRSYWELPKWLQDQNLSAKVVVTINSRGEMAGFRFIKSSGNEQFDNEVKRTLEASSPFPIPPSAIQSDMAGGGITLGFPI